MVTTVSNTDFQMRYRKPDRGKRIAQEMRRGSSDSAVLLDFSVSWRSDYKLDFHVETEFQAAGFEERITKCRREVRDYQW